MSRLPVIAAVALFVGITVMPRDAGADGAWLDGPVADWNRPGMAIPRAPATDPSVNPNCPAGRAPATSREQAVVDAGWKLYGGFTQGTPVEEMSGQASHDGMCRPLQFQTFIFVDGVFAGTLSPTPMDSRTDGSLNGLDVLNFETFTVRYSRYTSRDPLCCPSAVSTAVFEIDRSGSGPIVALRSLKTDATPIQQPSPVPSPATSPAQVVPARAAPVQIPAQPPIRR